MTQLWSVTDAAGALVLPLIETSGAGVHPRTLAQYGWQTGWTAWPIAARPDPAIMAWDGAAHAWVESAAAVEALLLAAIDTERERQRRAVMTQGAGQSYVYAQKATEVYDYRNVVGSLLTTLTVPQRRQRYPFAMAEADATGDALATVIGRIETALTTSRTSIARIDAAAVAAKRAIRTATTAAAKRAAAAKVAWPG